MSDSGPPPKRGRGRPVGTSTTSIAIREGRQATLSTFFSKPASTPDVRPDAVAEQPSFAEDVPKTVSSEHDAAPSTLGGFRTASGCCPFVRQSLRRQSETRGSEQAPRPRKFRLRFEAACSVPISANFPVSVGVVRNRSRATLHSRAHMPRATTAIGCATPAS